MRSYFLLVGKLLHTLKDTGGREQDLKKKRGNTWMEGVFREEATAKVHP
jgi:hypothetical protein